MTDIQSKNKVQYPTDAHRQYIEHLRLPHTLMAGTIAMRDAGEIYLPKEEGESDPSYKNRLERSILLNAFDRTLQKLTGEVFTKDVSHEWKEGTSLHDWSNDVDRNGKSISTFFYDVFRWGLADGATHVLVDFPEVKTQTTDEGTVQYFDDETDEWKSYTKSVDIEKGWHPFLVHIKARDVIGWRTERINGKEVLTQVRIKERTEEPDGDYGVKIVNRIRVLEIGSYTVYEEEKQDVWVEISTGNFSVNGEPLDYIPLFTFMPGEKYTKLSAKPCLEGLAYLNLMHWQSSSDQRNVLHYARLITYFGKMLEDEDGKITVGANKMILSNSPDGDFTIIEHSGAAIDAGANDLVSLENQMSMFGLTYMMPKTGTVTATEKAIDSAENDSALVGWAKLFNAFVNEIVRHVGYMMDIDSKSIGEVSVNTDVNAFFMDQKGDILLKGWQANLIPKEVALTELQEIGMINEIWDIKDMLAMGINDAQASNLSRMAGSPIIPFAKIKKKDDEEPPEKKE